MINKEEVLNNIFSKETLKKLTIEKYFVLDFKIRETKSLIRYYNKQINTYSQTDELLSTTINDYYFKIRCSISRKISFLEHQLKFALKEKEMCFKLLKSYTENIFKESNNEK